MVEHTQTIRRQERMCVWPFCGVGASRATELDEYTIRYPEIHLPWCWNKKIFFSKFNVATVQGITVPSKNQIFYESLKHNSLHGTDFYINFYGVARLQVHLEWHLSITIKFDLWTVIRKSMNNRVLKLLIRCIFVWLSLEW